MSEKVKDLFCQAVYERALLSYCFRGIDHYYTISAKVSDKDFLRAEHQLIWVIMGMLIKRKVIRFDSSTIIYEAQKNAVEGKIGGLEYLNAVVNMEFDVANIDHYISRVLDASTKHQLYIGLNNNLEGVKSDAKNDDVSSVDLIGRVEAGLMDLSLKSKFIADAINLSDGIDEYIEERKDNPIEYSGMSSGFSILDKRIDGLVPGTLHVVCARPKHGKSTLLSCISSHVAYDSSKAVLYIDTEMPFEQFRPRIISMLSDVPERKIIHGGYGEQEYNNLRQRASEIIKKGKFFHEYMPGYSVDKIIALYKKYKYREDIQLAVFDYIKSPSGADYENKKEYQVIGDVTTALKDIAGELNIPVLAANQINRQQDIADSDRVLRYADVLMFFKPKSNDEFKKIEEDYGKSRAFDFGTHKLMITDSRRGGTTPIEGIDFQFYKRYLKLVEAQAQRIDYDEYEKKEKEEFNYNPDEEIEKEEIDDTTEGTDLF